MNKAHADSLSRVLVGEGRGEGDFECRGAFDVQTHPHPNPLPRVRGRGDRRACAKSAGAHLVIRLSLLTAILVCTHQELAFATPPVTVVDANTEVVIKGALKFLASRQSPGGSWSSNGAHSTAITGYVLISYMAAGQLPGEGEYGQTCTKAVNYLLDCVRPDGYIAAPTGESNMYGHGIATIALGEVYGQTRDPAIRTKLERAVKLIIACQNAAGGWRYQPRIADADISVTVLQVVALRVARNSGLDVPQATIDRAVEFVKSCCDNTTGGFNYQPQSRGAGFARTAAAIYSLQVCGLYDDPMVKRGSAFLAQRLGRASTGEHEERFTYGSFYAAPAQYMIGGETWDRWYATMKTILLGASTFAQTGDGGCFWKPLDGGAGVNEIYATAVYTTVLAMPYGYLPLYQR